MKAGESQADTLSQAPNYSPILRLQRDDPGQLESRSRSQCSERLVQLTEYRWAMTLKSTATESFASIFARNQAVYCIF